MVLVLAAAAVLAAMPSARGQSSNVVCASGFEWLNNNIGQNPCLVTSYLISACGTVLSVSSNPTGAYPSPGMPGLPADRCTCSTVPYFTLSACAACQKNPANPNWDAWKADCNPSDITLRNLSVPIPQGTQVPAWAYLDLINGGFDINFILSFVRNGDHPDSTAPSVPTSTAATSTVMPIPSSEQTQVSAPKKKSSPVGAIVGGVIGGIAAIVLGSLAVWYILRVARSKPMRDPPMRPSGHKAGPSYGSERSLWPRSDGTSSPPTNFGSPLVTQPLRLYDPDDPSTFPPPIRGPTIQ